MRSVLVVLVVGSLTLVLLCGGLGLIAFVSRSSTRSFTTESKVAPEINDRTIEKTQETHEIATNPSDESKLVAAKTRLADWEKEKPKPTIPFKEQVFADTSGRFAVKASLVELDDSTVTLRKSEGGDVVQVPIDRLSELDQKIIRRDFSDFADRLKEWRTERKSYLDAIIEATQELEDAKAKEEARLAAINEAKIAASKAKDEKERLRKEKELMALAEKKATAAAERKKVEDAERVFVACLEFTGTNLVKSISAEEIVNGFYKLTITVDNSWHIRHKQIRLQDAQMLWESWAKIISPKNPDRALIEIVDLRGNKVGGSGMLGGSMISVID